MKINPGFYHSIRSVMCCQTKPKRSVAFFCLSKNLAERLTKDTSETFSCLSLWQPSHHLLRIQIGNMSENMALLCCGRTSSMCGLTRGRWRGRQRRQISRKCNEMGEITDYWGWITTKTVFSHRFSKINQQNSCWFGTTRANGAKHTTKTTGNVPLIAGLNDIRVSMRNINS